MIHRLHTHTTARGTSATVIVPDWPAPAGVNALFTTRRGGHSQAPWDGWNLGSHVGDLPDHVAANRTLLQATIAAQSNTAQAPDLLFLEQIHGCDTLCLPHAPTRMQAAPAPKADASVADAPGRICTIMVADCLPVLLAHRTVPVVAAAHAGWRGLAGVAGYGILESCFAAFAARVRAAVAKTGAAHGPNDASIARDTLAWLGPCIGPAAFEVGDDVRQAFADAAASSASGTPLFTAQPHAAAAPRRWLAHLPALACERLQRLGIPSAAVFGNDGTAQWCTVSQDAWFFSHRRDAAVRGSSGRMAACIWLDGAP